MVKAPGATIGHNVVRDALITVTNEGINPLGQAYSEPSEREHWRPDVMMCHRPRTAWKYVDVSITTPHAPTYLQQAQNRLGAATAREKSKLIKMQPAMEKLGYDCVPFVMEIFGALGTHAQGIIKDLYKAVDTVEHHFSIRAIRKQRVSRAISVSLVKGVHLRLTETALKAKSSGRGFQHPANRTNSEGPPARAPSAQRARRPATGQAQHPPPRPAASAGQARGRSQGRPTGRAGARRVQTHT